MTDIASLGFKIDSTGAVKATDNLQDLEQQSRRAEKAADDLGKTTSRTTGANAKMGKSAGNLGKKLGGMGRSAGQAGIQVQQFVGQVTGGVNPMVALSQQAADLGFVLGVPLVGAVAGIGAAIAGTLLPSLFKSKREAGEFTEELLKLTGGVDDLTEAQKRLAVLDTERQLREQKEAVKEATEANKDAAEALEDIRKKASASNLYGSPEAAQAARKSVGDFRDAVTGTTQALSLANAEVEATEEFLDKLRNGSGEAAESLNDLITGFEKEAKVVGKTAREIALYEAELVKAGPAERERINNAFDAIEAEQKRQDQLKQTLRDEAAAKRERETADRAAAAEKQRAVDAELRFEESIQSSIERMRGQVIGMDQSRGAAILYAAGLQAVNIENEELRTSFLEAAQALATQVDSTKTATSSLDELRAVYDPLVALQNQYALEVERINAANLGQAATTELLAAAEAKLLKSKQDLAEQTMINADTEQSFFGAFQQGLQESVATAGSAYDSIRDVGKNAIDSLADGFASFVATGKADFRSLAASAVQELLRIQTQALLTKALSGTSLGGFFGFAAGGVPDAPGTVNAKGNVFAAGGVPSLSSFSGSIVSKPTMFAAGGTTNNLMGEAGPEAILPLKRRPNGDLGIQAGGGGQAPAPNVEVPVQVINVTERPQDYLGSAAGVKQIVNIMHRNREVFQ